MGMENLGRNFRAKARRLATEFSADEGHTPEMEPKTLRAALIAAGALLAAPNQADARERHDPIGEIIQQTERKQSLDDLIARTGNDRDALDRLIQSIKVRPFPGAEDASEIACLAKNILYEGSVLKTGTGRESIGLVTLLRVISKQFPNSVCGVVYQRWNTKGPEFSWTKDEEKRDGMPSGKTYEIISDLAKELYKFREDPTALKQRAAELGITPETLFYKHFHYREHDPNDRNMSEQNKWWWRECVTPELDAAGKHVQHGPHQFYRASGKICPETKKSRPAIARAKVVSPKRNSK